MTQILKRENMSLWRISVKDSAERPKKYKVESPAEYLEVEETTRLSLFILIYLSIYNCSAPFFEHQISIFSANK